MSSVPDKKSQNINDSPLPSIQNKKRKRKSKNKNKKKNKALFAKKKVLKNKPVNNSASKIIYTMSSWAEHFTFASTWQLKHQLAYWKAKAKSLEYENEVLHDVIRRNHYVSSKGPSSSDYKMAGSDEKREDEESTRMRMGEVKEGKLGAWETADGANSQSMSVDLQSDSEDDSSDEVQDIEVSEEFIQFLMINAKHKEELKLERQKKIEAEEQAASEEREAKLKLRRHYGLSGEELYGDKSQRIAALEMSIKSNFMSNIDSDKPAYWPVVPFNFDLHYSYVNQKF